MGLKISPGCDKDVFPHIENNEIVIKIVIVFLGQHFYCSSNFFDKMDNIEFYHIHGRKQVHGCTCVYMCVHVCACVYM